MLINMLEFLRSGEFDGIKDGLNSAQIRQKFGYPDATFKSAGAEILKYGIFELHFFDSKIFMIFSDHFTHEPLNFSNSAQIYPWIFMRCPAPLGLKEVTKALNLEGIDHIRHKDEKNLKLEINSGITLYFESINESQEPILTAFWKEFNI